MSTDQWQIINRNNKMLVACGVFVPHDLWPFDPKINRFQDSR